MKNNRSKLLSVVAMLVISAVALTSASYAWFTMNSSVSANGLALTAASPAIVEISLDSTTFVTTPVTLPATSLSMRPTSTTTALNNGFFEVTSNTALVAASATGAFKPIPNTSGASYQYYYDVPLYFRTKGTYPINLTLGTLTVGGTDLNKAVRVAFLAPDGTAYSKGSTALIYASTATQYNGAATADTIAAVTPLIAGANNTIITVPVNATNANAYGATASIKVRIFLEGQDANAVVANVLHNLSVAMTFNGTEVTA